MREAIPSAWVPADRTAPRAARTWAAGLADRLSADRMADLLVMVSELVTNSARHAGLGPDGRIRLSAAVVDRGLQITVRDGGRGFRPPEDLAMPRHDDPGGRGLPLVALLADRLEIDGPAGCVRIMIEVPEP